MPKFHFIAGLPRSGSTLLAAILRQNPRFHAGMTSPVGSLYMGNERLMSRNNESAIFLDEQQKRAVLRGVFTSYYGHIDDGVVFDTNRAWPTKLAALSVLFPGAKVICCVRDVGWIMDSIERIVRRNAFDLSGMFGYSPGMTVYDRIAALASGSGLVGHALNALREGHYGEQSDRMMFVEYDELSAHPQTIINRIYAFIDERRFSHDFDHVEFQADDFDLQLGTKGLHQVRPKVEFIERRTILPPDEFARFRHDMFWRNPRKDQ